jgi:hypothetical protein
MNFVTNEALRFRENPLGRSRECRSTVRARLVRFGSAEII